MSAFGWGRMNALAVPCLANDEQTVGVADHYPGVGLTARRQPGMRSSARSSVTTPLDRRQSALGRG
ncbi:MAG: hypothetical protein J2P33_24015, partial [Actinobacteria bacterium]|nr:hypothetical protein [Actinomycetota bacterium]